MRYIYFILFYLFVLQNSVFGQVNIVADKHSAVYQAGINMNFLLSSEQDGVANYSIRFDPRSPVLKSGSINVKSGVIYKIPFQLNEPGFVLCAVGINGYSDTAGAGFSPYEIQPFENEPSDFDQFWLSKKAEINSIPLNPQLEFYTSTNKSETYKLRLSNIDNRTIYGYITIPKSEGPFPAILTMPSFGNSANHVTPKPFLSENVDVISLSLSIHNIDPTQSDPNGYLPDNYSDKNGNYYKYALLGAVKAIDYIFSRSDFDGYNLGVTGVSQGGGLAICVAGLDQRVKLLMSAVPALCQHTGLKYDRASGHPYYIFKSKNTINTQEHEEAVIEATKYYDAVNFAKRYHGPSMLFMSFEDNVCPPATCYAAVNQFSGSKNLVEERESAHNNPSYYEDRFAFINRHFQNTKFPDLGNSYLANAGNDLSASINQPISLSGAINYNQVEATFMDVKWEKVSGPGIVNFSTAYQKDTQVTFSSKGVYILKFYGIDNRFVDQAKRYLAIDYITIYVN